MVLPGLLYSLSLNLRKSVVFAPSFRARSRFQVGVPFRALSNFQVWNLKFGIWDLEFGISADRGQRSAVCCLSTLHTLTLVSRPRNTITFAEGACEARSRSEEEAMSGTSATTRDTEIARNPHQPEGWRRNGIDFLCRSSSAMHTTSRRRCFANSTPLRSPQTSWYSWDETLP